jgi:hypothetical protein
MSELKDVLDTTNKLLDLCESDPITATEAQREILTGTVAHLRQGFEEKIAQQVYEPDAIYIKRAKKHLVRILKQGGTYAAELRTVELQTLHGLPTRLVDFIRDHDNLHQAALRSRRRAQRAADPRVEMDVLKRIGDRLQNINMVYCRNLICETLAPEVRLRMQRDPTRKPEFSELSDLLADDMVKMLTRLELLTPLPTNDAELENVGADHNVDDFGRDISNDSAVLSADDEGDANDRSQPCCICLDAYDIELHPRFLLNACNHIIGKPCLTTWLNGISQNSNLCPHCRTKLCERRPRRPKPVDPAIAAEKARLWQRLVEFSHLMMDMYRLYSVIFGDGQNFLDAIFETANSRLAQNGVGFGWVEHPSAGHGRRVLRRVTWAEGRMTGHG